MSSTLKLMAEVTAICVFIGLVIVCGGASWLLGLFGPHFAAQQWVLIVLAVGTAFQAAGGPSAAILQLTGHEREYVPVLTANVVLRLAGFLSGGGAESAGPPSFAEMMATAVERATFISEYSPQRAPRIGTVDWINASPNASTSA